MIRNGGEEMKYDLNHRKELYSGDKVKVDILNRKYKVHLLKHKILLICKIFEAN